VEILTALWTGAGPLLRPVLMLAGVIVTLVLLRRVLEQRQTIKGNPAFATQIVMLAATLAGVVAVILVLPIDNDTRGQLLNFLGLLLTAAIALSSTTVIGNAMAGFMLRAVRNFRAGDFLRVGEHFGRVSERGLFHTEIQTETRDLTTLPNLYLVANPVTVTRASGTLISTEVSLGYDVDRVEAETQLLNAARAVGLEEPFVHIMKLGDFSVTYRVSGLLTDLGRVLTSRAKLRGAVMDALHGAGIEIVSPTFMNTRAFAPKHHFTSRPKNFAEADREGPAAEEVAFDKAEEVSNLEDERDAITREIEEAREQIKEIKATRHPAGGSPELTGREDALTARLAVLEERAKEIDRRIADPDEEG